jgi:hypothetical protein
VPYNSDGLRHPLQTETRVESAGFSPAGPPLVPGLTILHHPEADRVGERVTLAGLAAGREVKLSRGEPAFSPPGRSLLRPLTAPT